MPAIPFDEQIQDESIEERLAFLETYLASAQQENTTLRDRVSELERQMRVIKGEEREPFTVQDIPFNVTPKGWRHYDRYSETAVQVYETRKSGQWTFMIARKGDDPDWFNGAYTDPKSAANAAVVALSSEHD